MSKEVKKEDNEADSIRSLPPGAAKLEGIIRYGI
jgi:hypothetical protein